MLSGLTYSSAYHYSLYFFMKKLLFSLVCLLLAVSSLYAQHNLTVGEPVPEITITDWIANVPTDKSLENKFLVIDFWATWCGPCIAAVPHFNELQASVSDRKDVLFLSFTYESPQKVNRTLKRINFQTTVVSDQDKATQKRFNITAIPRTLIISPTGILLWQGHPDQLSKRKLGKLIKGRDIAESTESAQMPEALPEAKEESLMQMVQRATSDTAYQKDFQFHEVKGSSFSQAEGFPILYLAKSITLADLMNRLLQVPETHIAIPATHQDKFYDLFFLDKSQKNEKEAKEALLKQLLQHTQLHLQQQDKQIEGYQVSLADKGKLEKSRESFSAISEANQQVIFTNQPLTKVFTYLEKQFDTTFSYDAPTKKGYDFIINTNSLEAALDSLASYGITVQPTELEVTTYTLVQANP